MNKLILIGNGFDLAHGLPTSYNNFIDHFWTNLEANYKDNLVKEIVFVKEGYCDFFDFSIKTENFQTFWNNVKDYAEDRKFRAYDYYLRMGVGEAGIVFKFKNAFFKKICISQKTFNWVAIENEYYKELKRIVNTPKLDTSKNDEDFLIKKKEDARVLNREFNQVKELLKNYLLSEVHEKYNFLNINTPTEYSKFSKLFESNNFFNDNPANYNIKSQIEKYSKEFSLKEDKEEILRIIEGFKEDQNSDITFNTLALDFNYTSTFYLYNQRLESLINEHYWIKIHGDLNQFIFGFGDETDKDYQEIENIGDNEYLENFKSFQYSNTGNYDKLLEYIQSEKFQVYIMGHSCGLSDRVLLNTIFEHDHCRSIKIFYHDKGNGKDNYTDIVQNISRHFKDKASMRSKIVNKTLCQLLPQNVRFKEKE